jgi:hypothetical protein
MSEAEALATDATARELDLPLARILLPGAGWRGPTLLRAMATRP